MPEICKLKPTYPFNFEIIRSKRKSLAIYVKSGKVEVRSPRFASTKWIHEFVFEGLAKSFNEAFVQRGFIRVVQQVQDLFSGQSLAGIPAVKGIIIVTHKNGQVCIAVVGFQHHWRREPPQDGRHRPVADFAEYENLLGFRQV